MLYYSSVLDVFRVSSLTSQPVSAPPAGGSSGISAGAGMGTGAGVAAAVASNPGLGVGSGSVGDQWLLAICYWNYWLFVYGIY